MFQSMRIPYMERKYFTFYTHSRRLYMIILTLEDFIYFIYV